MKPIPSLGFASDASRAFWSSFVAVLYIGPGSPVLEEPGPADGQDQPQDEPLEAHAFREAFLPMAVVLLAFPGPAWAIR